MKGKSFLKFIRGSFLGLIGILLSTFILFTFLEGFFSLIWIYNHRQQRIAERASTKHDKLLGWVSVPNLYRPNFYGRGVYFKTNSQGFRSDRDFTLRVPTGKSRIICSGDSFTLGYGVSNDHAWCEALTHLDKRLETINMGQGGYGTDQAYLWYMRDGIRFDHQIQLFAFITGDIGRMQDDKFWGVYDKPVLNSKNGELVVINYPVPKRAYYFPRFTQNVETLKKLRIMEVLTDWMQGPLMAKIQANRILTEEEAKEIFVKIIEHLDKVNKQKHSTLVLVLFPQEDDIKGDSAEPWQKFIREAAQEKTILYLDLIEDIKKLPPAEAKAFFRGHYSQVGNLWVARTIYEKLSAASLLK